ncbi:MAG TPA: aminotransferase class V-fold PLP-dependent enzyme, partial [Thermomicrobiaceae bacterium]|nr:aminotransferase class V-fold PLP-dependent enzyme [Thermomicrobiaceae bacterium]
VVDTVTSLSGMPVNVDENQIDVAYSGSQKCLNAPPGMAPITFSEKALAKVKGRKSPVASWYLDVTMIEQYWGKERTYHHTAPITSVYSLHEALRIVMEEGLEERFARHARHAAAVADAMRALGLELLVPESERLTTLVTPRVPEGIDEAALRSYLRQKFLIEISGGLGPLRGKIWRIGLMGEGSQARNLETLLGSLGHALRQAGWEIDPGAGVAAFDAALRSAR